jgi:hypothetical protein
VSKTAVRDLTFEETYVVDRAWPIFRDLTFASLLLPVDYDPDYHLRRDGEWHAVVSLPHDVAEFEGYAVPAFDLDSIDPERAEWLRRRS